MTREELYRELLQPATTLLLAEFSGLGELEATATGYELARRQMLHPDRKKKKLPPELVGAALGGQAEAALALVERRFRGVNAAKPLSEDS